ncbi:MAG: hypothetical protein ACQKBV_05855 [Puniceicoccales bacterium]
MILSDEAAIAMREQKWRELAALSDEEALRATESLLSMPSELCWRSPAKRDSLGLIERQKILYGIQ